MSGILSSYIVEPVLRQARRFSIAARPAHQLPATAEEEMEATEESDCSVQKGASSSSLPPASAREPQRFNKRAYSIEHITSSFDQQGNASTDSNSLAIKGHSSGACARQSHVSHCSSDLLVGLSPPIPAPPLLPPQLSVGQHPAVVPSPANASACVTSHPHHHAVEPFPVIAPLSSRSSCQSLYRDVAELAPLTTHHSSAAQSFLSTSSLIGPDVNHYHPLQRSLSFDDIRTLSRGDETHRAVASHNASVTSLLNFQRSAQYRDMEPHNAPHNRRTGSDGPVTSSSDTNLLRQHFRTRRYSWTQSTIPRNGPRRPPLLDHYTDSLLVASEDNSRSKQDEDIMSRESELRRRIQEICLLTTTNEEKAKRIHYVMNERYLSKIETRQRKKSLEASIFPGRPQSPDSNRSDTPSAISNADLELYTKFNVLPADLVPTKRPRRHSEDTIGHNATLALSTITPENGRSGNETPPEPEYELGCDHYKRNVKIQCFDCKSWWNCRYCHDQAELDHPLPRHKTENMLCMLCQTPGPAGQYCEHCGEQAAYYFCEICKLWDDDTTKRIYHCTDCGICRLGEGLGKDFQHCKRCNVCIPFQQFAWHKCLERATDCDCPICGDYMFTSKAPIVSMPCGHYLHRSCYDEYMVDSYQCPICKKSARNMESQWWKMEEEIARQPMPTNLRNVTVDVRCNDCGGKSRVSYHWLGNKCALCDSFNTTEIEIHREGGLLTASNTSPPRGNWRTTRNVPQRTVRRYFEDDEAILHAQQEVALGEVANAESLLGLPNTAYELLATMTRNLSPIRRYLNNRQATDPSTALNDGTAAEDADSIALQAASVSSGGRAPASGTQRVGGVYGDDDLNEEDDDYESSDEDEDEDFIFDDESDVSSDGGLGLNALDVELIGHR